MRRLTEKDRPDRTRENSDDFCLRISKVLPNVPLEVVMQWLYDHFDTVTHRYSWLDLTGATFTLEQWKTEEVIQRVTAWNEMAVENWKRGFLGHPPWQSSRLGRYMIEKGTWPVPPIVLRNHGPLRMPDGSTIAESELVEGHHRLAYLRALVTSDDWTVTPVHRLWVLRVQ